MPPSITIRHLPRLRFFITSVNRTHEPGDSCCSSRTAFCLDLPTRAEPWGTSGIDCLWGMPFADFHVMMLNYFFRSYVISWSKGVYHCCLRVQHSPETPGTQDSRLNVDPIVPAVGQVGFFEKTLQTRAPSATQTPLLMSIKSRKAGKILLTGATRAKYFHSYSIPLLYR